MAENANVWKPGTTLTLSGDSKRAYQSFGAAAGQTLFQITDFAYVVGTQSLQVYKNGLFLIPGVDFIEQTTSTFTLTTGANLNDEVVAVALIGITGNANVAGTTDIMATNYQAIRDYLAGGGTEITLYARGRAALSDGGEKMFTLNTGAAPGTYVDNNDTILVPTGGAGDAGWVALPTTYAIFDNVQQVINYGGNFAAGDIVQTAGYYSPGDRGGNTYQIVSAGTGTADGGSFIDLVGGTYQAKGLFNEGVNLKQFGAVGDGTTNDATALQKCGDYIISRGGGELFVPDFAYRIDSAVAWSATGLGEFVKLSIVGEVAGSTSFDTVAAINVMEITGNVTGSGEAHQPIEIKNIRFNQLGTVGTGTALILKSIAYMKMDNVIAHQFNIGVNLQSVLSSQFESVRCQWGNTGMLCERSGGFSYSNALNFQSCVFRQNAILGVNVLVNAANMNFNGGSFESNGTQGNNFYGAFQAELSGIEGNVGVNFNGVYFEHNRGGYDVHLDASGAGNFVACTLEGCNFNRISNTAYTDHNIRMAGKLDLNLQGCSFQKYNSYVADATRTYADFTDSVPIVHCDACNFEDAIEKNLFNRGDTLTARLPGGGQSIPDSTETDIVYSDVEVEEIPQAANYNTSTGVFTVPDGVHKISVVAGARWTVQGAAGYLCQLQLSHTGSEEPTNTQGWQQTGVSFGGDVTSCNVSTGPINTVPGNEIKAVGLQKSSTAAARNIEALGPSIITFAIA